jgi:ABC-2 type transport system ATP-binding protein
MHTIEAAHLAKRFGDTQAVADVSFVVERGEIFGLLGPNGAGKTTTIRMVLDLFKPDHGTVTVFGGAMDESAKERTGYMPEERGLYQDVPLDRCLLYLASLKGVTSGEARRRLDEHLDRFDLSAHRTKKIKELSKGMQQKAQVISTILHQPDLIIIDEPFAALDPINTQLVKDVIQELRADGAAIVMSTHQMRQVEEMCDRILLIAEGENILYGELDEIRRQFAGHAVLVRSPEELPDLPGVQRVPNGNGAVRLELLAGMTPQQVLRSLVDSGVQVHGFEIAEPTLDEVFIQAVGGSGE